MESYLILAASLGRDVDLSRSIALNVANSATPGFKRWLTDGANASGEASSSEIANGRDLAPGKPVMTGLDLDIFLPGSVYMALESGDALYSRGGRLSVDKSGQLLTDQGTAVHVEGGAKALPATVKITADGRLMHEGQELGRLTLVQSDKAVLVAEGVYRVENASDIPRGTVVAEIGAYESSNVQVTDQMVAMMKTLRHLESVQRVLKHEDGLNERLFSTLAKF